MALAAWLACGLAVAGTLYQLLTAAVVIYPRHPRVRGDDEEGGESDGVTILKPLHGPEPRLLENLATFASQAYPGAVEIICGVQNPADPAIDAVTALRAAHPDADIALVVDSSAHGSNAKVSNLINMIRAAKHDLLVFSDSDMAAPPGYLAQVVETLLWPEVGAVTCFYTGRGDAGRWSRLAALAIDYGYLPSGLFASRLGLAQPCMGSTIVLSRETLAQVGGLARVADVLADDHALGVAVGTLGLQVAVAPVLLEHGCTETSLAALARHELRWNLTIFRLQPWGFTGLGLLNPLPVALVALLLGGFAPSGFAALAGAFVSRLIVAACIARLTGRRPASLWLLPVRDILSFGLFLATFFGQSVDWRGTRLDVSRDGRLRS